MNLVKNKLRVAHYPQVPCKPFLVEVKDEIEAKKIIDTLANQHLFLFEKGFIHDYSNVITVQMWDENSDGENTPDWAYYYNYDENMEWEEFEIAYLDEI